MSARLAKSVSLWMAVAATLVVAGGVAHAQAEAPIARPSAPSGWTGLYVFGDSYSDSGAGNLDSNGPTAVVYMAQDLGLALKTAGGRQDAPNDSLNFAVSGAQSGAAAGFFARPANAPPPAREALFRQGIKTQVAHFVSAAASGKIRFDPPSSLFFLAGGLNDGGLPTEVTASNIEDEVRTLYKSGARRFALALLPENIPAFHAVATRLNPAISALPGKLGPELPGARIIVSHWGHFFDEVISSPGQYGIRNTTDACAPGHAIFGEAEEPCAAPDTYFYYHEFHPSTAVHRIVGGKLAAEIAQQFPGMTP